MKITDEAVRAAVVAMNTNNLIAYDSLIAQQEANARSILTAAIPHLQPVDAAEKDAEIERLRGALARLVRNGQKQGWNDSYEDDMDFARAALSGREHS